MCTVTFLPLTNSDFILTSNRDEQRLRETLPPKVYIEDGIALTYPKDTLAGGTWIGVSDKNRLICVLNGAFKKHTRLTNYKKSRGLITKELLKCENLVLEVENLNLIGIEPFTMVLVDWSLPELQSFELVWDGTDKHFTKLELIPKIWASSTLYEEEAKKLRIKWFENFLKKKNFSQEAILKFHHSEIGDKEQAILMKRNYIETVSITSVKKEKNHVTMAYEDLVFNKKSVLNF